MAEQAETISRISVTGISIGPYYKYARLSQLWLFSPWNKKGSLRSLFRYNPPSRDSASLRADELG